MDNLKLILVLLFLYSQCFGASYPVPKPSGASVFAFNSSGNPTAPACTTANRVLRTTGSAIQCAQADLTTDVTGTLPIANGGTNSTATPTAGGIGYGTGTAHAYTSAGTSGQFVVSGGSGTPTFLYGISSGSNLRVETVTFGGASEGTNNCTGSPCTIYRQSGSGASVTRGGTGTYTFTFGSAFSAAPVCTGTSDIIGTGPGLVRIFSVSTTNAVIHSYNNAYTISDSGSFHVSCIGAR